MASIMISKITDRCSIHLTLEKLKKFKLKFQFITSMPKLVAGWVLGTHNFLL